MQQALARTDQSFAEGGDGVVVRRPRRSDAIGNALRQAFAPDHGIPGELLRSLDALDKGR